MIKTLPHNAVVDHLRFVLPYPPSLNNVTRHSLNGHYVSDRGREWSARADAALLQQKVSGLVLPLNPWTGPVHYSCVLRKPDQRRRDLDNVGAKVILDKIRNWQIIHDDEQIVSIFLCWHDQACARRNIANLWNLAPGQAEIRLWRELP